MCDFKPGDELVAVDDGGPGCERIGAPRLVVGAVYVCAAVGGVRSCDDCGACPDIDLVGLVSDDYTYCACSFRKVERRNDRLTLETLLTIKPGQFEEPKRATPAKKWVRAQ